MRRGISLVPSFRRISSIKMLGAAGPIFPKFSSLDDGVDDGKDGLRENAKGFMFRFVSYNILAQELDEYDNFYKGNMEKHGYSSVYVQRTGQKRDGCGIFYKLKSAELILSEEIHYNDLVDINDCKNGSTDIGFERTLNEVVKEGIMAAEDLSNTNDHDDCGNRDDPCVRLKRDCVGLLAAFKLNDPSKHVLAVANTHIYWDPAWADVKLSQVKYLLSRLSRFKEIISNEFCCTPSVIVAGDFNSTPGDEVYEYITSRAANVDYSADHMQLYSHYRANGGEPLFTNCTPDFTGTLDYIFLSDACHLKAVSLLEVPGPESMDIVGGLPNHYHPSDHLPIGGDFELLSAATSEADHLNDVEASLVELKLKQ